jgi:hypothetical protein
MGKINRIHGISIQESMASTAAVAPTAIEERISMWRYTVLKDITVGPKLCPACICRETKVNQLKILGFQGIYPSIVGYDGGSWFNEGLT